VLEFCVSVALVALSVFYVVVATTYGSTDRLLPMIVGTVAVIVGAMQSVMAGRDLVAHRRQRAASPGAEAHAQAAAAGGREQPVTPSAGDGGSPAAVATLPASGEKEDTAASKRQLYRRELMALGWVIVMAISAYVFGFVVGVPLVVLLYGVFGAGCTNLRNRLAFAASSTIVMAIVTYAIFNVLHLTYQGVLSL
jgi:hypothetical protein